MPPHGKAKNVHLPDKPTVPPPPPPPPCGCRTGCFHAENPDRLRQRECKHPERIDSVADHSLFESPNEATVPTGITVAKANVGLHAMVQAIDTEIERARVRHNTAPRAIDYVHLLGRYIEMHRPATQLENELTGESEVGMEGVVRCVKDQPGGFVDIYIDYGEVWSITPNDALDWRFTIWLDKKTGREGIGRGDAVRS